MSQTNDLFHRSTNSESDTDTDEESNVSESDSEGDIDVLRTLIKHAVSKYRDEEEEEKAAEEDDTGSNMETDIEENSASETAADDRKSTLRKIRGHLSKTYRHYMQVVEGWKSDPRIEKFDEQIEKYITGDDDSTQGCAVEHVIRKNKVMLNKMIISVLEEEEQSDEEETEEEEEEEVEKDPVHQIIN